MLIFKFRRLFSLSFANVCPAKLSGNNPHKIQNLVNGKWKNTEKYEKIVDPLNKNQYIIECPLTNKQETEEFKQSMLSCPIYGLHNPLNNIERYTMYGKIIQKVTNQMHQEEVLEFFIRLIMRVAPKSYSQAKGEVVVTRNFLENFCGDNSRFLLRGFTVPGDYKGQQSNGYRFPYGPVNIIAPFNFPLEIPVLQLIGALISGNKVLIKSDNKVSIVLEQFIRLMLECGMPSTDVNLINCDGITMQHLLEQNIFKMTQFTGSSKVAEHLAQLLKGKIKIEDAGFNWKLLGPDVEQFDEKYLDYVAYMSDHDAYAYSGQKCSAQSILYMHTKWQQKGFIDRISQLAQQRKLSDLTICPILSWNNTKIQNHVDSILKIKGSRILFGGKPLTGHNIPECYGSYEPTAIFVPFDQLEPNWQLVTTELFGPFQIITSYTDSELPQLIKQLNSMTNFLTCAVVSNDQLFLNNVLGQTINGTTYNGIRARTTGAPQNHWFGPAGDPRSAGIGSQEAILLCWSYHREIINDYGPIARDWTIPPQQ